MTNATIKEDLLTHEEIQLIIEESKNEIYSDPFLLHLRSEKTAIRGVSRETGVIMVHGNNSTGYEHIRVRHGSRMPHWTGTGKLQDPTQFKPGVIPLDYVIIAAAIFQPQNKNDRINKNPDLFDAYKGQYTHKRDGQVLEYVLITYKDTPVVHTLYLSHNKKPFNKRKVLDLAHGIGKSSFATGTGLQVFEIPYFNSNRVQLYKVIVRHAPVSRKETWYIQVNHQDGQPFLTTRVKEFEITKRIDFSTRSITIYYHEDLSWIEKIIGQIDNKNYLF